MITLVEIRDRIIDDLDLEEEVWVDAPKIDRHINDAIKAAERQIHTLYEDYFLDQLPPVAISTASNLVPYPSDIYANKIRKIIFSEGGANTTAHEVIRTKNLVEATSMDLYSANSTNATLMWSPVNSLVNGRNIRLFPSSSRNGQLHIWYIRNARQLVLDTDVLDIDEFEEYIIQKATTAIYLKDGDPRAEDSKQLELELGKSMVDTLADMAPDKNNEVHMDTDHYTDSVGGDF